MLIHKLIADEMKVVFNVPELNIVITDEVITSRADPQRQSSGSYNMKDQTIYVSSSVDILSFVATLCHEIVHHYQVKWGYLKRFTTRRGKTLLCYNGKWYAQCPSYHEQPWEHDAFRYESIMARRFYSRCSQMVTEGIRHYL